MIKILDINKIYNMDCLNGLKQMNNNSIDLMITSPPYYNARDYSHWKSLDDYKYDMKMIFEELYRCMVNHKYIIVNVGDVVGQVDKAKWSNIKIPLGAIFINILSDIGYTYIDDYIWDKGEVQSKRQLGNPQYPFYQYPLNCYEHILIFAKHELDKEKITCPICNKTIVVSNSQSSKGVQSWECKNPNCPSKSKSGRGKRFSKRSIMMNNYKTQQNYINDDIIKKWRRDIVKINPVVKINCKGENIIGHTAPFPEDIPEMAVRFYSGVNDLVVDIFSGSGTTCKVAKCLHRNYIGFELSKEYCDIAEDRIKNYK